MIILINNNELKIKDYINIKNLITTHISCISINDIINDQYYINIINFSLLLISLKNIKVLNILRHSCAHLMAHAIQNIYKNVKFAIGPVIKNGFYYDFFIKKKITNIDLVTIENEMNILTKNSIPITKYNITLQNARKIFKKNKYKTEILKNLTTKIVSFYKQKNFLDLCLGPHVKNTKFIKYFKLIKLTGAYWRNNNKNDMLYRIYGTIWNTQQNLKNFLNNNYNNNITHKKIGFQTNLFCFEKHSTGVVFWQKNGWYIYRKITTYLRMFIFKNKFNEVNTPLILNSFLFDKSGHTTKFNANMFKYQNDTNIDILKPMNCPCHINIFNNFYKKSYKDLPYRLSEFGSCFRNEVSGSLHGLMRLKSFTQDDGHIFCSEQHIETEIKHFIVDLKNVYYNFGFKIFKITIAKRPINTIDDIHIWEKAEELLEKIITSLNIKYFISNDGAFYGPKIEVSLKDNIGRYWQCGTIQIDFFSSKRLNTYYSDKSGLLKAPIILHRAILGSIERFFGILIENRNGDMPFWLTPFQFDIIYINHKHLKYAKKIYNVIIKKYTVRLNILNERLEQKIKKCILEKIPYIIILGDYEEKKKIINIKHLKSNKRIIIPLNKFIRKMKLNTV
ncbi:MAG TPA: threonine--tRNA ligase [Candidatus Azoamicus sp. OHIO2]